VSFFLNVHVSAADIITLITHTDSNSSWCGCGFLYTFSHFSSFPKCSLIVSLHPITNDHCFPLFFTVCNQNDLQCVLDLAQPTTINLFSLLPIFLSLFNFSFCHFLMFTPSFHFFPFPFVLCKFV